jgi:SAM-dependent methyltransferase
LSQQQHDDLWDEWPQWESDSLFRTKNLKFVSSWAAPDKADFSSGRIPVHKPRELIERYAALLRGPVSGVVEIGYLHGGMIAFLADMLPHAKIVGIDLRKPPEALVAILADQGMADRALYYSGIDQEDAEAVRTVLEKEFGDKPIDLITDDASHFYEKSKKTFEACFGYLRPGGSYVIEDWAWAHWNHPKWQAGRNIFSGTTPLSRLLFELTMIRGSQPWLSCLTIETGAFMVATRGKGLPHGSQFDIDSSYLTAGRSFVGFEE